jgi:hypothetical protein
LIRDVPEGKSMEFEDLHLVGELLHDALVMPAETS